MSQTLCPSSFDESTNRGWIYSYLGYTGRETIPSPESGIQSSLNDLNGNVIFQTDSFKPKESNMDSELWVYYTDEEGISLSTENKLLHTFKATSPPSFYEVFELFMEDCNGVIATFGLEDISQGRESTIDLKSLVYGDDLNDGYVVKIGYHLKNPKSERKLKLIVDYLNLQYMVNPQYCTPQEVVDFLGLTDNRGEPLIVTDATNPSYNALAKRIIESEDLVEATTRQAFVERRVENEIRNVDSELANGGYIAIYAYTGYDMGAQAFFKGHPVKLTNQNILPIDYSKGDKVEIRRYGSLWTEVPEEQIWADETKGIIFVKSMFFQKSDSVRVTYRYGKGPVPPDLKRAVIMQTALLYLQTDWMRAGLPQSPEFFAMRENALNNWVWTIKDLLRPYTNVVCVSGM